MMMGGQQPPMMGPMMTDPIQMQKMMKQMNKTSMMKGATSYTIGKRSSKDKKMMYQT